MGLTAAVKREAIYLGSIARTLWLLRRVKPDASHSIVDIVEAQAKKHPANAAILYQGQVMTYAELDARANRYAHWALAQGIGRGTPVALLMENRPDFICAWLGMFKVGAQVALINTNLVGAALSHSITVSGSRHAIVGAELVRNFLEAPFDAPPALWLEGVDPLDGQTGNLTSALAAAPDGAPDKAARAGVTLKERAFFIYTSGTTGLPKAANFSHMRMLFMMSGFVGALRPRESDRIYDPLPLYHSTGGVCAVGLAFFSGGALIIKRKFSVHEFWSDVHAYGATMFEYIGELCRYLLNAPPSPLERGHNIRAITGNGLRPEIWREFQARFAIPRIVEFYGATESNVSMLNYDGTVGAVGRVPDYLEWLLPSRVVRFDVEKEMPVRGPNGLCIECRADEVGEAIGGLSKRAGREFEGYTNRAESDKKMLRDVFRHGDMWFRTGDLMRRDAHGYFYFVDRIGDTFRWKGENVSTGEVGEALAAVPGILEANVYGVTVPGMEGRAGMASLVVDGDFRLDLLAERLQHRLAPYARPIFLRLSPRIDVTGTFKQRKMDLVREGFDPSAIADPLYVMDAGSGAYERLTPQRYGEIIAGQIRL
ncbi:MAG: long-chain-acyl-CoA synthetase [Alphaproteobacteria bacterium]|nr:long-chain-acyl-CoA synthetase [Alphaproteobacteria bacterium]